MKEEEIKTEKQKEKKRKRKAGKKETVGSRMAANRRGLLDRLREASFSGSADSTILVNFEKVSVSLYN